MVALTVSIRPHSFDDYTAGNASHRLDVSTTDDFLQLEPRRQAVSSHPRSSDLAPDDANYTTREFRRRLQAPPRSAGHLNTSLPTLMPELFRSLDGRAWHLAFHHQALDALSGTLRPARNRRQLPLGHSPLPPAPGCFRPDNLRQAPLRPHAPPARIAAEAPQGFQGDLARSIRRELRQPQDGPLLLFGKWRGIRPIGAMEDTERRPIPARRGQSGRPHRMQRVCGHALIDVGEYAQRAPAIMPYNASRQDATQEGSGAIPPPAALAGARARGAQCATHGPIRRSCS